IGGALSAAEQSLDHPPESAVGEKARGHRHEDHEEPGEHRHHRTLEAGDPRNELGRRLREGAHERSGLSPVMRTWILSFFTRYQRLRSVMPRSLAARAWTPWAFWSASRMARRSHSSRASSREPVTTGAVGSPVAGVLA